MNKKLILVVMGAVAGAAAVTWVYQNPEKVDELKSHAQQKVDDLGNQVKTNIGHLQTQFDHLSTTVQQQLAEFQAAVKSATSSQSNQS